MMEGLGCQAPPDWRVLGGALRTKCPSPLDARHPAFQVKTCEAQAGDQLSLLLAVLFSFGGAWGQHSSAMEAPDHRLCCFVKQNTPLLLIAHELLSCHLGWRAGGPPLCCVSEGCPAWDSNTMMRTVQQLVSLREFCARQLAPLPGRLAAAVHTLAAAADWEAAAAGPPPPAEDQAEGFRHGGAAGRVPEAQQRLLQGAIVGVPNAGKSTLINALVGHKVGAHGACATAAGSRSAMSLAQQPRATSSPGTHAGVCCLSKDQHHGVQPPGRVYRGSGAGGAVRHTRRGGLAVSGGKGEGFPGAAGAGRARQARESACSVGPDAEPAAWVPGPAQAQRCLALLQALQKPTA